MQGPYERVTSLVPSGAGAIDNRKYVPKDISGYDGIIFGHSHRYLCKTEDGVLWLNPGSCEKRRFDQEISFAMMTVDEKEIYVEKILIPQAEKK
ncbi:MAG: metallophosphoesterase family protein [Bulleidia sp.]